jgi:hypothetical protein
MNACRRRFACPIRVLDVVVISAGGHAKEVISTLRTNGRSVAAVFEDDSSGWGTELFGVPICGPIAIAENSGFELGIIAIGDNVAIRKSSVRRVRRASRSGAPQTSTRVRFGSRSTCSPCSRIAAYSAVPSPRPPSNAGSACPADPISQTQISIASARSCSTHQKAKARNSPLRFDRGGAVGATDGKTLMLRSLISPNRPRQPSTGHLNLEQYP